MATKKQNPIIQNSDGHFYEIVGQRPILKRVGDSVDQDNMRKAIATAKSTKFNRTGRGEVYKQLWNKDGSLAEGCAPYQKVSKSGRCVVKRKHVKVQDPLTGEMKNSKKWAPLDANVVKQRKAAEQAYLTQGLSRQQQIAKAVQSITEAKDYLASDAWGNHQGRKAADCDKAQEWSAPKGRCVVKRSKVCKSKDIANCEPGTYPRGWRQSMGEHSGAGRRPSGFDEPATKVRKVKSSRSRRY